MVSSPDREIDDYLAEQRKRRGKNLLVLGLLLAPIGVLACLYWPMPEASMPLAYVIIPYLVLAAGIGALARGAYVVLTGRDPIEHLEATRGL